MLGETPLAGEQIDPLLECREKERMLSTVLMRAEAGNPHWRMLGQLRLLLGLGVPPELLRESKADSVLLEPTNKHITCRLRLCVWELKACGGAYASEIYVPIYT